MHRRILIASAIIGALGVAIGAFGAHGLQKLTQEPEILEAFDTGARYQLIHAVALLALAAMAAQDNRRIYRWAAWSFVWGTIFFSGSLYLLTFLKINGSEAVRFVGPMTPIGGLLFVVGWVTLLAGVWKKTVATNE